MFNVDMINKIDKQLHKKISILFDFEFNGLLFFYGKSLKDLMMNNKVTTYSFLLLTYDADNVQDFVDKNGLDYKCNLNGVWEIKYNNVLLNIRVLSDLCYDLNFNTDYLFYDVYRKQFIPVGIKQCLANKEIIDYGDNSDKLLLEESKKFINYFSDNKRKRIKIRKKNKDNFDVDYDYFDNSILNRDLANRLDEVIKDKFSVIYDYKFSGIVLLYGGAIRNTIMDGKIKDFDFVILTQGECEILDFIKRFKLRWTRNAGGGYKILWEGFEIDMFSVDDLFVAGIYDTDMLFYDIEKRTFITCGALRAIKRRVITEVNSEKEPLYSNKLRLKKIIKFIKWISNNDDKVLVRQNTLLWEFKMFKKRIKLNVNKIVNGNFRKCFRFIRNCKKEFCFIIILGIIVSLIAVFFPALSGKMITGILYQDYKLVIVMVLLMVILKVLNILVQFLFSKLYLVINKKMIFNIRKDIANCVLNFEMDNFSNNNRGTFIDKLKTDPNEITRVFNSIKDILIRGVGNFGVLLYIFYLDYRLGLVLLIFMFIIFEIKMIGIRKRKKFRQEYYYEQERYSGILGEMINGVGDIKGLNLKDSYIKRAVKSFEVVGENEFRGDYYQNIYNKIANFVELVAMGVIVLLGLILVKNGLLEASSLIIIYMYNSTAFAFLERIGLLMSLSSDLNVSCNRIFSLLDGNLYATEVFGKKYNKECLGKIEFKDVNFKYKYKNNYVLRDCSFAVNSNETVAIVGKSGVGKTTILNLIARLYDVDSGSVFIDNEPIREYSEEFIRDNVSVISQSPYLFDMSIKDNLRLVNEGITDNEIKDICKLVCMDEVIESLPGGYDTVIGEGGIKLSVGQKQRLGIARALIKKTKIILLDEITSALDNETGSVIKQVIKNIQKDRTIIIVTHELSMIKDCSRILILDDGKISGDGTHKELVKNNDIYQKLYKLK